LRKILIILTFLGVDFMQKLGKQTIMFNTNGWKVPYIPEEIVCPQPGGDDRLRFVALQDNSGLGKFRS
jgi:hypothetical protein